MRHGGCRLMVTRETAVMELGVCTWCLRGPWEPGAGQKGAGAEGMGSVKPPRARACTHGTLRRTLIIER